MVVGVLTFHHVYNYGALLQVYALQRFLTELGHDVQVLDVRPFHRPPPFVAKANRYLRPFLKVLASMGWLKPDAKTRKFDRFRNSYINLSAYYKTLSNVVDGDIRFDALIVGSDQVWNPKYGKFALDTYFATAVGSDTRKIGYAVCCGTEFFDEDKLKPYASDILGFDLIGARDDFTKKMVKVLSGRDAEVVVDPTILIEWDDFGTSGEIGDLPKEYIFYYGYSKKGDLAAKNLSSLINLPVVNVGMETDRQTRDGYQLADLGPLEWVEAMRRSSYVITKSFHGLMLALKLRKPVLIVPLDDPSAVRLVDAANRFGAEEALLPSGDMPEDAFLQQATSINWSNIWRLVDEAAVSSRKLLKETLEIQ